MALAGWQGGQPCSVLAAAQCPCVAAMQSLRPACLVRGLVALAHGHVAAQRHHWVSLQPAAAQGAEEPSRGAGAKETQQQAEQLSFCNWAILADRAHSCGASLRQRRCRCSPVQRRPQAVLRYHQLAALHTAAPHNHTSPCAPRSWRWPAPWSGWSRRGLRSSSSSGEVGGGSWGTRQKAVIRLAESKLQ